MLHKMGMEQCDHCGRITEEEKIDEHGICKHCYERASLICRDEDEDYEGDVDEY